MYSSIASCRLRDGLALFTSRTRQPVQRMLYMPERAPPAQYGHGFSLMPASPARLLTSYVHAYGKTLVNH
jgi:hypothetical protein